MPDIYSIPQQRALQWLAGEIGRPRGEQLKRTCEQLVQKGWAVWLDGQWPHGLEITDKGRDVLLHRMPNRSRLPSKRLSKIGEDDG